MKPTYIRSRPDFDRLITIGTTAESSTIEFKERYDERNPAATHELRKDATALANTWGGVIVIGVSEAEGGDGRKVASAIVGADAGRMADWIPGVLAQKIHPPIRHSVDSFRATATGGGDIDIVVLNVRPHVEGLGCLQDDKRPDWFCVPYRDDFGVKYYHPAEALRHMNPSIRRIEILVNDLEVAKKEVRVASPIYLQRMETDDEREVRLRSEFPNYTFGGNRPAHLSSRQLELPLTSEPAWFGAVSDQQLEIVVRRCVFTVPFGAIRELWTTAEMKLAVALQCDLVLVQNGEHRDGFVRF